MHLPVITSVLILPQDDGILVIPTVADYPLKLNTEKGFSSEFHDRAFALSSIASISGCCQVINLKALKNEYFPSSRFLFILRKLWLIFIFSDASFTGCNSIRMSQ